MSDFKTLKFLDRFQGLFRTLNIEYPILRKILETKLTLDQRRVPTILNDGKKREGNQFIRSLWIYVLFSLILLPFLLIGDQYIYQMTFVFSIIMFFLLTAMISDFSTVLLDVRDKVTLDTKPIHKRTINAAKVIHISIYMFFIVGALTAVPLVVGLMTRGFVFFLLFAFQMILIALWTIMATALVYMLVLQFLDGEKLKDVINYVQILLSIGMIVGTQLVARSFEFVNLDIVMQPQWWQFLLPPFWYSALFEVLLHDGGNRFYLILSGLGIVIPILSIMLYIYFIPSFERNLEKLLNSSQSRQKKRNPWYVWMGKIWSRGKESNHLFHFALNMMKNEREFKLKVYPAFIFAIVIPFLFILNEIRFRNLQEVSDSYYYLTFYGTLIFLSTAAQMLLYSEKYKGAWIYGAMPISDPNIITKGALKALFVHLYIPVYIIVGMIYPFIFSMGILYHFIPLGLTAFLYVVISYRVLNGEQLPFTQPFGIGQKDSALKNILLLIFVALFGGLHYAATLLPYGVLIFCVILLIANMIVWKITFRENRNRALV
ncbi:hypothetical protein KO561_18895 [Radiobacillus kanasensis]|uniref:hypothetical protein n=1 Tax=Radiobacillus kanasensis TaxID=2844358 RepID=UPI001E4EB66F|nr:hypothetical protein [Radiobacillus kanasensis]UFT99217.1 hypothetical protein KO561_18895 [Radiobacillus kanasensis]